MSVLSSTRTKPRTKPRLKVLAGGVAVCLALGACSKSVFVPTEARPPMRATKHPDQVAIEPSVEGRAFTEIGVLSAVGQSKGTRAGLLAKEAAEHGADAIIDIQVTGKVPVAYIMFIPITSVMVSATAIRWDQP